MQQAINQANLARKNQEVPVGTVLIYKGKILEKAYNKVVKNHDPTDHAELILIKRTIKRVTKFLHGTQLYITLEPCKMCAEVILLSRIKTVIFGAYNKTNINSIHYHKDIQIIGGVLEKECTNLLKNFFKIKRLKGLKKKNNI